VTEESALKAYAAMINTGDVSRLEPLLPEDFHYASQWVFAEIKSKSEYLKYITGKLVTVRESGNSVWAEMGEIYGKGPCVVIAQGGKNELLSVVLAGVEDGKLKRQDMCCVPSPLEAKRSGIYPV